MSYPEPCAKCEAQGGWFIGSVDHRVFVYCDDCDGTGWAPPEQPVHAALPSEEIAHE